MRAIHWVAGGVALGGVALVGTSCSSPSRGELVIAVQSDLSLPKDIDSIQIETRLLGSDTKSLSELYLVPGEKKPVLIPATLGLIPPDDPDAMVEVAVTALSKGQPRIVYQAETQIPTDRVGLLRMPLRFLCGEFHGGDVYSRCPAGQTCDNGECVPTGKDRNNKDEIPDFSIAQVTEDGTGECDGTCFDAVKCFEGLPPLALDIDHFNATKEVDENGKEKGECLLKDAPPGDINVGLITRGEGVCGSTSCFAPLVPVKAQLTERPLKLSSNICSAFLGGTVLGVVAVNIGQRCPKKYKVTTTLCGGWTSVGSCDIPPVLHEVIVAAGEDHPASLAVSDAHLYWTTSGALNSTRGTVKRYSLTSGTLELLDSKQAFPRGIAVTSDDTVVWWANAGGTIGRPGPSDGDTFDIFEGAGTLPEGITIGADGSLFFTLFADGQIMRFPPTDSGFLSLASGLSHPYRIVAEGKLIYWTNEGTPGVSDGSIDFAEQAAEDETSHGHIAVGERTPRSIAVRKDDAAPAVYWTSFTSSGEVRVAYLDLSGQNPTLIGLKAISLNQAYPNGVAVDLNGDVYWTNWGDGTVMCVPHTKFLDQPAAPVLLASNQRNPGEIVLSADEIFWINEGSAMSAEGPALPDGSVKGDGSVMRMRKRESAGVKGCTPLSSP